MKANIKFQKLLNTEAISNYLIDVEMTRLGQSKTISMRVCVKDTNGQVLSAEAEQFEMWLLLNQWQRKRVISTINNHFKPNTTF